MQYLGLVPRNKAFDAPHTAAIAEPDARKTSGFPGVASFVVAIAGTLTATIGLDMRPAHAQTSQSQQTTADRQTEHTTTSKRRRQRYELRKDPQAQTPIPESELHLGGQVSVDNHGGRYTGYRTGTAALFANNVLTAGDRSRLVIGGSAERLWFGDAHYSVPLGATGFRANAEYSQSEFHLGRELSQLGISGVTRMGSLGLSYPMALSPSFDIVPSVAFQHSVVGTSQRSTPDAHKNISAVPVTLGFNLRDTLAGPASTYGAIIWTPGKVHLDSRLRQADTLKTDGSFQRIDLHLGRTQSLPANFQFFGGLSAQWADSNLDGSEKFSLGGASGVRGYPSGEAGGDAGALAQAELRYKFEFFTPYGFYDYGVVRFQRNPQPGTTNNQRTLSSTGVGLRFNWKSISFDASASWRLQGGHPQADIKRKVPTVWMSLGYGF